MSSEHLLMQESHFAFGKNWLDFAEKIDEPKIAQAIADLQRLCGRQRMDGMAFLDIGCGSGLHSLAAIRMGAARVVGVDIDSDSVVASQRTLQRFAPDADAKFHTISVFDLDARNFGGFDFVYSWGVLHHTGDMYRALRCAAGLVKPGGVLMLALYKRTPFCGMWRIIKRWYSQAPQATQKRAMASYIMLLQLAFWIRRRDFARYVLDYQQRRGMNFQNDVHDWLGGFPYESISSDECHIFYCDMGFFLEREFLKKPRHFLTGLFGSGCDEFVFRRA